MDDEYPYHYTIYPDGEIKRGQAFLAKRRDSQRMPSQGQQQLPPDYYDWAARPHCPTCSCYNPTGDYASRRSNDSPNQPSGGDKRSPDYSDELED